jgi:YfiH family protein
MARRHLPDSERLNQRLSLFWESLPGGLAVLRAPAPGAGVIFTARAGGVSAAPYDSLNLSLLTGDDPAAVQANRRAVAAAAGIAATWATARQVHGCQVHLLAGRPAGEPPGPGDPRGPDPAADAVIASRPGQPVAVFTADCVPIALVGEGVVGAVHAGWRGLCAGVVASAAGACRGLAGRGSVQAWLGPCIGPCCYEVGDDVLAAFAAAYPAAPGCTERVGRRRFFDLRAAACHALAEAGMALAGDAEPPCTSCDLRFFSHRRDGRDGRPTGRQALVAWLEPAP